MRWRQFKLFASSTSTEDLLFDEDAMKKMKPELKVPRTRSSEKKFGMEDITTRLQKTIKAPTNPAELPTGQGLSQQLRKPKQQEQQQQTENRGLHE